MTHPFHYDMPAVRISDSEIVVQKQCLDMIAKLFPNTRVAAVPNGGKRTRWQQQQAKREGVSAGFPDLVLVGDRWAPMLSATPPEFPKPTAYVLRPVVAFPEIKAKASLTAEQTDWLTFMAECGHHCGVFRSDRTLEEAMRKWGFR